MKINQEQYNKDLEFIVSLQNIAEEKIEMIQQFNRENKGKFSKLQIKILRSYIKSTDIPGMKIRSPILDSDMMDRFRINNGSIRKSLDLSEEDFYTELKLLFVKKCFKYQGKTDLYSRLKEIYDRYKDSDNKLIRDEKRLNFLYEECALVTELMNDKYSLEISNRGISYVFESMVLEQEELKNELESNIRDFKEYVNSHSKQISDMTKQSEQVKRELHDEIGQAKREINKFHENIVTILAILISAFSVIGLNVNSIPKIENDFLVNLLAVNLSILFSITSILWLLNKIVFRRKDTKVGGYLFFICVCIGGIIVNLFISNFL